MKSTKPLDDKDRTILKLLFEGKTAIQIGKEIFNSSRTVEFRLKKLRDQFGCKNNVQLAVKISELNVSENT